MQWHRRGWVLWVAALVFQLHFRAVAANVSPARDHVNIPSRRDQSLTVSANVIARQASNSTGVKKFKTEPRIEQLHFEYLRMTDDPSLLSPETYLFLAIQGPFEQVRATTIYDTRGNLIWYEHPGVETQDFHVCDYMGERQNHLCLHLWDPRQKEVYDQNYNLVWTRPGLADAHEFNVLPGGRTFITVGGRTKEFDLTPYTGSKHGYVHDACLFEYDMKTLKELYKWCYLEHNLPIWATNLWMELDGPLGEFNKSRASDKAGKGTEEDPWAFTHVNAGEKYDGDYYMSIRYLDQIIKFAGPENKHGVEPGTVLWRLGGEGSDFDIPLNLNFTRQHHVRVHSIQDDYTVLSIFNNGWEGSNPPSVDESSGMMVGIDNKTMKAELIQRYQHPDGTISKSRGSMQVLSNGNVLVGYGRVSDAIEYSHDGTILSHLQFTRTRHDEPFEQDDEVCSYRIFKQNWTGLPKHPPKAIAYSKTCNITPSSPLMVYVSWNGATEVTSYRFHVATPSLVSWIYAGTFSKTGFETRARLELIEGIWKPIQFVLVEALDWNGSVLGTAQVKPFVPRDLSRCDETGCEDGFEYNLSHKLQCPLEIRLSITPFLVLLSILEASSLIYFYFWYLLWNSMVIRRSGRVYKPALISRLSYGRLAT